jgi:hypothetical protein
MGGRPGFFDNGVATTTFPRKGAPMKPEEAKQFLAGYEELRMRLLACEAAVAAIFESSVELRTAAYVTYGHMTDNLIASSMTDTQIERVKDFFHALIDPRVASLSRAHRKTNPGA